jgi:hypothetical protein
MGRWELLSFHVPSGEDTSQVGLLHSLAKIHATFDDPNLVSRAGLVPVMALAQRAGLAALTGEHVRIGRRCGVNAQVKVPCLVAGERVARTGRIDAQQQLTPAQLQPRRQRLPARVAGGQPTVGKRRTAASESDRAATT